MHSAYTKVHKTASLSQVPNLRAIFYRLLCSRFPNQKHCVTNKARLIILIYLILSNASYSWIGSVETFLMLSLGLFIGHFFDRGYW